MTSEPVQGNWTEQNERNYSFPKLESEKVQKFVISVNRLHRISNIYWYVVYMLVAITIIANMLLHDADFFCSIMAILTFGLAKLMLDGWKNRMAGLLSNTYCESQAACEVFSYLCKFQTTEKNRWSRKVQYVSCLLNANEKEKAMEILADGRTMYPKMRKGTQMFYDFLWSSYFFEINDKESFTKSVEYFKNRWTVAPKTLMQQKCVFIETLGLKEAVLNDNQEALGAYCNLFKEKITYPFDYYKYHYYLGLCEAGKENYEVAKGHFEILKSLGEHSAYRMDETVQKVLAMENVTATDQRADAYREFPNGRKQTKKLKTCVLIVIIIGLMFYIAAVQYSMIY